MLSQSDNTVGKSFFLYVGNPGSIPNTPEVVPEKNVRSIPWALLGIAPLPPKKNMFTHLKKSIIPRGGPSEPQELREWL